jgi:hypothetical protein
MKPQTLHFDAEVFGDFMDKYFRLSHRMGLTRAASAEGFYGFRRNDVARLHFHKQGLGSGLFFRLHDGRVFDVQARPHDPDPSWYDATTH